MTCNQNLTICDYKKGDMYNSFDIVIKNDFDFTITSAKFEIIKSGSIVLNWPASLIGPADADGSMPIVFEKLPAFDTLAKGIYKLELALFDGTNRKTIPANDWRVL